MSSSDPAYRHIATVLSPPLDLEDVTVSKPGLGDGRCRIEDVARLVAYRQEPAPLRGKAPGHQLIGQLRHSALVWGDDDTAQEIVAREAEQVEPHRCILNASERGQGATGPGPGAGPCRSQQAPGVPSTGAGR